jgi:FG-GAP-like repeat
VLRLKGGLWLLCLLALAQVSPAHLRAWAFAGDSLQPLTLAGPPSVVHPAVEADLDGDGRPESVRLSDGRAEIISGGTVVWQSPAAWQAPHSSTEEWRGAGRVSQAAIADLNRDGQPEVALLVRRPFQPWPMDSYLPHPGRIADFHDAAGFSCHVILIGWGRQGYQEVWAGSAMSEPFLAFAAADLDGDGREELAALESDYADPPGAPARSLSVWEWNGFGFTLLARTPGPFRQMAVIVTPSGQPAIVTQE